MGDPDSDFLLNGIRHGFDIVDNDLKLVHAEAKNHPSAIPGNVNDESVKQQILNEISEGNYVVTNEKPCLISPLGAVSKSDGGIRLIHDCSRPGGTALNDYVSSFQSQKFQTIDDATDLVHKGYYMAKVDLKSAYRSVSINSDSQRYTGLQFSLNGRNIYMYDSKLPFGSRLAPGIFHRLTQAVKRMMVKRGFTAVVVYLDDFFVCESTADECAAAMATLVKLLRSLGFRINWNKVVDPTQRLTFLGIEIDTMAMCKRLPCDKMLALKETLLIFSHRKRATKKQLQSLAGSLSWAAGVVFGGRVFLRRIINAISSLTAASHKCIISLGVRLDIDWWNNCMNSFNGSSLILDDMPVTSVCTDACNVAAGGHFCGDWFYSSWEADWPDMQDAHINVKELASVILAANRWAPLWSNKRIIILSDNSTTVSCLNRGTSSNCQLMKYLRYMFWLSVIYNFRLTACHVPGVDNVLADRISRLHEVGAQCDVFDLIVASPLKWHMSSKSYMYVINRSQPSEARLLGLAG